jgi:membrane-associated phospholipid phosphatase
MTVEEVMRDTTAFGGYAMYAFVTLLFLILGEWNVFAQLIVGIILCYAFALPIRYFFFRRRPDRQKYSGFFTRIDAGSFPSIHSTRVVILALVLCRFFNNPLVSILLALGVLGVIVTRVTLKRHYLSDALGGAAIGGIAGWLTLVLTPHVLAALG